MCGSHTTNHSCGVFLGGYNIRENSFDKTLLLNLGINPDWMPEIYGCEDIVGEVNKTAAKDTGLSPGTLVSAGQCDFNAGCIGAGLFREGDINMNLGTCGNFGVIHKDSNFLDTISPVPLQQIPIIPILPFQPLPQVEEPFAICEISSEMRKNR